MANKLTQITRKNNKLLDINLKIKKDIDYLLNNLKNCPLVILNKFTNNQFYFNSLMHTKGDRFCEDLNNYIKDKPINYLNNMLNILKI